MPARSRRVRCPCLAVARCGRHGVSRCGRGVTSGNLRATLRPCPPQRDHYRQARRLALLEPTRRPLAPAGGLFCCPDRRHHHVRSLGCPPAPPRPAPPSATPSTSTTRRCATAPSGRGSATRSPTSSPSPRHLDALGVGYIEGGWPGALPKDTEFFARAAAGELHAAARRARRVRRHPQGRDDRRARTRRSAPCSTRRPRSSPSSRSPTAGTSSGRCAPTSPRTARWSPTPWRSCAARAGGSSSTPSTSSTASAFDPDTALRVLDAAVTAGADVAVLCDTNGGMLPLGHRRGGDARSRPAPASGSASTARTTPAARWPTPSPRCRRARRTCSAPPTATGSGPATPTCSPSSGTS